MYTHAFWLSEVHIQFLTVFTIYALEVIVTTNQQVPIFALPNSTVRFDCSVIVPQISSPPNITLNWWYSVDGFVDVTTRNRSVQFEPQNLRHSLILENVTFEDSGSYACSFADNILDSNTFLLIVVEGQHILQKYTLFIT